MSVHLSEPPDLSPSSGKAVQWKYFRSDQSCPCLQGDQRLALPHLVSVANL